MTKLDTAHPSGYLGPVKPGRRTRSRIASAEVVVAHPGRNFVTLIVTTDDGLVGLGDATLNGRELAVEAYLTEHVIPTLIGRDPAAIEDTWQYLYRGSYWRRGPVTMAAIAAVDVALWDIKAQNADMPLYELLGGASRKSVRAYGHATGLDFPELARSIGERVEQGFDAVRIQAAVPGLVGTYGTVEDGGAYEPATIGERPAEELWDTASYLRHIPTAFDFVRAEFGDQLGLLHDAHHRLSPNESAQLGKSLERFRPFWIEDVTPIEDQAALRIVRSRTSVPLALGETLNSVFDYQILITERLIDYARSSVTHAGGISGLRRILDFASIYGVKSAIHGPTDISPVGFAAALHLDLAIHNFGIQEYMQHDPAVFDLFDVGYTFADGQLHPGERSGLGVVFDREKAATMQYRRAYLPVNRLRDGTLHDW